MPKPSSFRVLATTAVLLSFCGGLSAQQQQGPARTYDFIVVGGGTAGLAVANRLTEDPKTSVLVIEAGGSPEDFFFSQLVFFNSKLFKTGADWNYTTTPMPGLGGRATDYPQGHILGGTSTLNGAAYTRGSSDDYDRYARITGDEGWSWKNLQAYIRKNEKWVAPADHHNTTGEFNPAVHGFNGVTPVSVPGYVWSFDKRVVQASHELPEFNFKLDMNDGNQIGIGWTQSTIKDGVRASSATAYYAPKYARRPNLHVLLNTRVTRLLQTNLNGGHVTAGIPVFTTVEYTNDATAQGKRNTILATKEVILAAGVIGSPHILQHSGIGNATHLQSLGINPLINLPSVGQNLTDHAFVANTWLVNSTDTFETALRNETLAEEQLKQWNTTKSGPYAAWTFNNAGWFRVPENSTIFNGIADPSAGKNTAHFEWIIANGKTRLPIPPTGNFMVIGSVVITPSSRGTVLINSSDPFINPLINPNLLADDLDLAIMREAIRAVRRFSKAPAFSDYILELVDTAQTDDELNDFIRKTAVTVSHCVGTAAMSAKDADWGVVDPDLKVKKVKGLRVVDSSVLPLVPAGHTQFATYMIAERGSDLIKKDW